LQRASFRGRIEERQKPLFTPKKEENAVRVRKKMSEGDETVRTSSGGRKVSIVLPPELAERVERRADARGDRLTTTLVRLIEAGEKQADEAIRADALSSLRTELLAEVSKAGERSRQEVKTQAHRLSHLLARTALESIAGRVLTASLFRRVTNDAARAEERYENSWNVAVQRLSQPTPAMKESLNLIAAGVGDQPSGALVHLATAAQEVQEKLETVDALAGQVEALEEQQKGTATSVGELTKQVQSLRTAVVSLSVTVTDAVTKLNETEEEVRNRPRGLFGRG